MKKVKQSFVKEYLNFTRRERNGSMVLLSIITMLIIVPFLFPLFIKRKVYDHTVFAKEIAALKVKAADTAAWERRNSHYQDPPQYSQPQGSQAHQGTLFYFDPNTLDATGWQKLGIRDKTIATIQKYISKGGHFYKSADIHKIWGLSDQDKRRLEPYIKIPASFNQPLAAVYTPPAPVERKVYTPAAIDINSADTTSYISLPGIGSKLAQRIVTFRNNLGGFYKIDQVAETFGLPDSTWQKIRPRLLLSNPAVKQLNINTCTLDELKTHPYIRYVIANAIIQYRTQHGKFNSIYELTKINIITQEFISKISAYITAE